MGDASSGFAPDSLLYKSNVLPCELQLYKKFRYLDSLNRRLEISFPLHIHNNTFDFKSQYGIMYKLFFYNPYFYTRTISFRIITFSMRIIENIYFVTFNRSTNILNNSFSQSFNINLCSDW